MRPRNVNVAVQKHIKVTMQMIDSGFIRKGSWLARLLVLGMGLVTIADASESSVGKKIEAFSLSDVRGQSFGLPSASDTEATVVVFLGTECPLANAYAPRIQKLADEWAAKKVRFLVVMSNQQDSLAEIGDFAKKHELKLPLVKDPGSKVADLFGAERTPEAYVVDKDHVVRYVGRIDDQYGIGYQRPKVPRKDLEVALEQVLNGNKVEMPYVKSQGCLIGRVKRPVAADEAKVTFHKDVSHLFRKRCVDCHHEGNVAPFSLVDYNEVVGWAEMIREVVTEKRMPPWTASPEFGHFSNNPSLTDDEKKLIYDWIDDGCPEGNPADGPGPLTLAKGWAISEPDQVFYMSDKPYHVPAEGTVNYQYYIVDPGFTEDHWIKEAEVRAGNAAIVHHVIVFIDKGDGRIGQPQMAYAPGMSPRKFPDGHAIRLPAGCKLRFQVHYTPNGKAQDDRSYVGFKYADPKTVTHEVVGGAAGVMAFVIPPGDPNYRMIAFHRMQKDTVLIGMNPHMHVRGKSFRYEAKYPDGRTEVLLDVPKYDFNWQLWYNLTEPKILPKGTELRCTAYFDNSTNNPSNPDPTKRVTWGEQTWDEMMFGFYSTVETRRDRSSKDDSAPEEGKGK
ncbi:redoxin domain-containing protein [bacterium]|nr:redoxin domain-containing protein [bacterium]